MKHLNKKKRNLKGMTLVECIIAVAILGVMTLVLVVLSTSITSYLRSANDVNKRVADQAPVAEVGYVNAQTPTVPGDIRITLDTVGGNVTVRGRGYRVYDDAEMAAHSGEYGDGLNMTFITDIQAATEAPST